MRHESIVLSASWIPSEAISGMPRLPFDLRITHYDDPPPETMTDFRQLLASDRLRFVNELRAWVEVEDGEVRDAGYSGGGHLNVSTVHLGPMGIAFAAARFPDIQRPPRIDGNRVTFVQTAGGRTALPAPRHVRGKPHVQVSAPTVWTTLALTIDSDGRSEGRLVGASAFPRHWVYDESLSLTTKAGVMDFEQWYHESFGPRTPWGDTDLPARAVDAETALERTVSGQIMRKGRSTFRRAVAEGETVVRQGESGDELFLVLDGVLAVEVDGERVAEVGPGAILGERAMLESGRRTATLKAVTPCRLAVARLEDLDRTALEEISAGHRREDTTV
ncbi:MAG TPA: cyclic nucleotide-binding domain-containing protein [Actinomycetales bacterium]|nr:cyclic nucleotide-binding domain-containing protein [Actinomycetales bacterium]